MNKLHSRILRALPAAWLAFCWMFPAGPFAQPSRADSSAREYVEQYLPITPFLPPEAPSRNYLQRANPLPPWKPVTEPPPLFEEAVPVEPPQPPQPTEDKTPEPTGRSADVPERPPLPPVKIPPISIEADDRHHTIPSPEITVSPWFSISSVPSATPATTGSGVLPFSSNAAPGFIRRKIQGGNLDVYIPFSISPDGYNPPPAPSAVIYTQPD